MTIVLLCGTIKLPCINIFGLLDEGFEDIQYILQLTKDFQFFQLVEGADLLEILVEGSSENDIWVVVFNEWERLGFLGLTAWLIDRFLKLIYPIVASEPATLRAWIGGGGRKLLTIS